MPVINRLVAGLAAGAVLLSAASAVQAEPAPSPHAMQLAKRYFDDLHMEQQMDQMMRQMMPVMMAAMARQNPGLTADQQRAINEAAAESTRVMVGKLTERMIPLFASTFTEKELQDLVTFYESPTGRAMMAKMPVLMQKMTPTMVELMPQMQQDMHDRLCAKVDCTKLKAPPAAARS